MRVLVTGASGLIGSHLCHDLIATGHEVLTITNSRYPAEPGKSCLQGDIAGPEARAFAQQAEAIVHLAGLSDAGRSYQRPLDYASVNAQGTINMLEAARQSGARFVFASSQRLYRPQQTPLKEDDPRMPVDPYGYTKLVGETWAEMYRRLFGMTVTVLRFFSVFGPGQRPTGSSSGVVAIFAHRAIAGLDMRAKSQVLRDFTYVSDVTSAIQLALEHPRANDVFNAATGIATPVYELAQVVRDVAGSSSEIIEETGEEPVSYVADISRIREQLGYQPCIDLREGLERYVHWVRESS